jgi:hypothetical protein
MNQHFLWLFSEIFLGVNSPFLVGCQNFDFSWDANERSNVVGMI